jgi:hypothetical protein
VDNMGGNLPANKNPALVQSGVSIVDLNQH